jgi:type IV pilus assembly protein PilC
MAIKIINNSAKKSKESPLFNLVLDNKQQGSFRIGFHKFGNKQKLQFFSDFSVLLHSGVDIVQCLEIVKDNFRKQQDQKVIVKVIDKLTHGMSFSNALAQTGQFSTYEYYSIEIGEESGTLDAVVTNLVQYYKRIIDQKRKIISAFTYPILVLLTAVAALSFMIGFVVPMFEEIFNRYGQELPFITLTVIRASHFITGNAVLILFMIIAIIILFYLISKKRWYKKYASGFVITIPFFGDLIKKIYLLRLCTAFELLLKAKTPLTETLDLLEKMISFYPISITFPAINQDIQQGKSLFVAMNKFKIFDKRMMTLINVTEQINQLPATFQTLKEQYTEEINYKTSMMGNILEPVLIVLVGLIVGVILISMYLPIFEFSSSVTV